MAALWIFAYMLIGFTPFSALYYVLVLKLPWLILVQGGLGFILWIIANEFDGSDVGHW